jgi:NAD(P)-dependent dehydrogenase (short-subunit alcohol dehydrogenase family)
VPSEGIVQDRAGRKGKSEASERRSMRFQGKVALITAAASGIGRATANIIGHEGGRIAAVDINRERLEATVAEVAAAGGEAHAYNADASMRTRCKAWLPTPSSASAGSTSW